MSNQSPSTRGNLSGKLYDPVFLCMLGAVLLAVATSVALRAVVANSPTTNRQSADPDNATLRLPTPKPATDSGK